MTYNRVLLAKISLLCVLLFSACITIDDKIQKANEDGIISPEEFQSIAQELKSDRKTRANFDTDDKIQNYINTVLGKSSATPTPIGVGTPALVDKPNYLVFIENSSSMDGYVEGNSEFKSSVYSFLTDIINKNYAISDSMKLFYINSKMIPFPDDVKKFIETLEVKTFTKYGGNRGESDLNMVLKRVLDTTKNASVAVLISDFVFSPGEKKDANNYLSQQSSGIKKIFSDYLFQNKNAATVIIKSNSSFKGVYYDYLNKAHPIKDKRPYYIWLIGDHAYMKKLTEKVKLEKIGGEVEAIHSFYPLSIVDSPKYKILRCDKLGEYQIDKSSPHNSIINARAKGRGADVLRVAVGIDMAQLGLDGTFLQSPTNYELSNKDYTIEVQPITEQMKQTNPELNGFTHKLLLTTSNVRKEQLEISLKRIIPQWVENSTSQNDVEQTGDELNKTFGFRYLFKGVDDAYRSTAATGTNADIYFKIILKIDK